jgi:hypothetical protein
LSQLKATFGAAFTAQEGERLERLSAGFGKSPAANRRILEQSLSIAERAANRGIKAAEALGDPGRAQEIRQALTFTLGDESTAVQAAEDTQVTPEGVQTQETVVAAPADRGPGQIMVDAQGNRARVFADGTFEEL